MHPYQRNIRFRFYRFFWVNAGELSRWAGKQMIRIVHELTDHS